MDCNDGVCALPGDEEQGVVIRHYPGIRGIHRIGQEERGGSPGLLAVVAHAVEELPALVLPSLPYGKPVDMRCRGTCIASLGIVGARLHLCPRRTGNDGLGRIPGVPVDAEALCHNLRLRRGAAFEYHLDGSIRHPGRESIVGNGWVDIVGVPCRDGVCRTPLPRELTVCQQRKDDKERAHTCRNPAAVRWSHCRMALSRHHVRVSHRDVWRMRSAVSVTASVVVCLQLRLCELFPKFYKSPNVAQESCRFHEIFTAFPALTDFHPHGSAAAIDFRCVWRQLNRL